MGIRISIGRIVIGGTGGGVDWIAYWATLISATVENAAPTHVVLTFPTAQTSLVASDFTIAGFTVNNASWAGTVLTLVLAETVKYTDSLIVTFVKTGGTAAVTNNIIPYFITTWQTENAGSATKTIVIPTAGAGYACYVTWGDGSAEEYFSGTAPFISHVYPTTGIKTVKIRGLFPRIYFHGAGDKLKLLTIAQWGNIVWGSMGDAFWGCTNMVGTYSDYPNVSAVENMTGAFYNCAAFNQSVAQFDTANVTSMFYMFYYCTVFNQSVINFNTAKVMNFKEMLAYCPSFKQSLATFSLAAATNLTSMLNASNINTAGTTTNYDATLVSFAAQAVTASLSFHGGTSKYGEGLVDNGTTDGAAANKLIQSGQNFVTTVTIGDVAYNTTDGTYARVTAIDSDTQLALDADIMANAKVYRIQHSAAAKARASLIKDDLWTITDGGYL